MKYLLKKYVYNLFFQLKESLGCLCNYKLLKYQYKQKSGTYNHESKTPKNILSSKVYYFYRLISLKGMFFHLPHGGDLFFNYNRLTKK